MPAYLSCPEKKAVNESSSSVVVVANVYFGIRNLLLLMVLTHAMLRWLGVCYGLMSVSDITQYSLIKALCKYTCQVRWSWYQDRIFVHTSAFLASVAETVATGQDSWKPSAISR